MKKLYNKFFILLLFTVLLDTVCYACDKASAILNSETNNGNGTYTYVIQICLEYNGLEGAPDIAEIAFSPSTVIPQTGFTPATFSTSSGDIYTGSISSNTIKYTTPSAFIAHGSQTLCFSLNVTTVNRPTSISILVNDYPSAQCTKTITLCTPPNAPTASNVAFCPSNTVNLTANGCSGGSLRWYSTATSNIILQTGNNYTTPLLTDTDSFYVACELSATCTSPRTQVKAISSAIKANETHVNPSCGISNGSIDITASGGVAPYTYTWNDGALTEDRFGLAAGTYTITVTDALGTCAGTKTITLVNPSIIINQIHTDATCGLSNGTIDLTVYGGTAPYTYNWGGGIATQDRTGLGAGIYTVLVSDAAGCSATLSITILASGGTCISCPAATTFTDPGGTGNYPNNSNVITTFCSNSNSYLSFSFSGGTNFFDIDMPGDSLLFYDGTSTTGTPIAILTYLDDNTQTTYSSQLKIATLSTCVTTRFTSNASGVDAGFSATVTCENPPTCAANPPAADIFGQAPLICNLNGYCGTTTTYYGEDTPWNLIGGGTCPVPDDGIFGGTIENNSWLSFIADATTATFNFTISNCGSGSGLQLAIFGFDGTNFSLKSPCATTDGSQTGNTTLTASGLTIGQKYYIMIDGSAGSTCDYVVSANSGVITVNAGPDQLICSNTTTLAATSSLGSGIWTVKRGTGNFSNPTSPITTVSGLTFGQNVFVWTSTSSSCNFLSSSSLDSVVVNVNCVLPVELTSFSAQCYPEYTLINWQTASENENDYFLLKRAKDDLLFETIATIKGAGNSNSVRNYSYKDYTKNAISFYQLEQVDFSGKSTNSKLIVSKNKCQVEDNSIVDNVYYNTTLQELNIVYNKDVFVNTSVDVVDLVGRVVYSTNEYLSQGNNKIYLSKNVLSKGIYVISISLPDQKIVKKVCVY